MQAAVTVARRVAWEKKVELGQVGADPFFTAAWINMCNFVLLHARCSVRLVLSIPAPGWPQEVGYAVRFEERTCRRTRIKYLTGRLGSAC